MTKQGADEIGQPENIDRRKERDDQYQYADQEHRHTTERQHFPVIDILVRDKIITDAEADQRKEGRSRRKPRRHNAS